MITFEGNKISENPSNKVPSRGDRQSLVITRVYTEIGAISVFRKVFTEKRIERHRMKAVRSSPGTLRSRSQKNVAHDRGSDRRGPMSIPDPRGTGGG